MIVLHSGNEVTGSNHAGGLISRFPLLRYFFLFLYKDFVFKYASRLFCGAILLSSLFYIAPEVNSTRSWFYNVCMEYSLEKFERYILRKLQNMQTKTFVSLKKKERRWKKALWNLVVTLLFPCRIKIRNTTYRNLSNLFFVSASDTNILFKSMNKYQSKIGG